MKMERLGWDEKTFSKFAYLSDINISKDGSKIAYVLTKVNLEANKYENTIVIEEIKSGERRYIENAMMPRFCPDNQKISFIRIDEEKKKSELFLLDIRSMSSKKLLEIKNLVSISWNNDGRRILIVSFKRRDDEDLFFDESFPVWFNQKGFLDGERAVMQVYDAESEETLEKIEKEILVLPYYTLAIWHKNAIIYNAPKRENPYLTYDIYSYEDGKEEKMFENVSFRAVDSNEKVILLHGKPKKKYLTEHNFLYTWNESELLPVTEKFVYNNIKGRLDGTNRIFFTSSKEGKVILESVDKGERRTILEENAMVADFDVSYDGKVAFLKQTDTEPNEAYIFDGKVRKLTNYNELILKKIKIKPSIHFRYKSFDGMEIDGWYMKPEVKEKAPLIVFVHGGPKGMYGYSFDIMMQLLADKGFYILYTNPRGSDGYDEEFALKVLGRTGCEDFQDIMKGIEWVIRKEENVDENRIGITGISYGGFMTNWALTQSKIFKAGVSENGISYWLTSYAFSDIGLWFDKEIIGEDPLKNENYKKLSPIFYAENVSAPLLIIHSLEDYRCPLDQSLMFYHVLKDLGKEAYIAIFKRGEHGHSIRGLPRHRAKRHKLIVEFFIKKLIKGEKFNIEEILGKKE